MTYAAAGGVLRTALYDVTLNNPFLPERLANHYVTGPSGAICTILCATGVSVTQIPDGTWLL